VQTAHAFLLTYKSLIFSSYCDVGERFLPPDALSFESPVKYYPYLYAVPFEFLVY
jgi:hypothetical protein